MTGNSEEPNPLGQSNRDADAPAAEGRSQLPVLIVISAIALAFGVWASTQVQTAKTNVQIDIGTVLPAGKPLPAFELSDQDGNAFTADSFKGKWSFVFFGYTFCPDICPTALATFREVRDRIAGTEAGLDNVQFVFVSVDPERDSPARLKEYVQFFSPDFQGVTGEREQIDRLVRASGAVYMKVPGGDEKSYLVDHSASVFLMGPDGGLTAFLRAPHDPSKVVPAFEKIRAARG
ncbi:MAG: SCO family protein [Gammaproteobacteria bacterium]